MVGFCLSDVGQRVVDGALFRLALMLVEIRLKLLFGFVSIRYKFRSCAECQFANIAIRGVRSAPDESDDSELPVRHNPIIAGHCYGVNWLQRLGHNSTAGEDVERGPRQQPRSGARMQPMARAMGSKWETAAPQQGERLVATQSLQSGDRRTEMFILQLLWI